MFLSVSGCWSGIQSFMIFMRITRYYFKCVIAIVICLLTSESPDKAEIEDFRCVNVYGVTVFSFTAAFNLTFGSNTKFFSQIRRAQRVTNRSKSIQNWTTWLRRASALDDSWPCTRGAKSDCWPDRLLKKWLYSTTCNPDRSRYV